MLTTIDSMTERVGRRLPRRWLAALLVPALLMVAGLSLPAPLAAQGSDAEDRVEELERQLEELRQKIEALVEEAARESQEPAAAAEAPPSDLAEVNRRLELLAEEIERMKLGEAAAEADQIEYGLGPAASKVYRTERGVSLGGYGEGLYERFDSSRDDGSPSGSTDELDLLRAVVYFGYKFNDRWLLNTEIEFEHASTSESGSASVEFAYLDYLWKPQANLRFGLVLVPMGLVNELHEPVVFLGARRPDTENAIIPSTWRENGFGVFGDVGDLSYRAYIVNGLEGADFSSGGLRGGRQKGSQALAEDLAFVGRLDYTGVAGLILGGSLYVGDSGQTLADGQGSIGVTTTIWEAHAEYRSRGLRLGGLYARASLDDVTRLNDALGFTGSSSVGEELEGYYIQASYDVFNARGGESSLSPYLRWEQLDTQAEVPFGFSRNPARDRESLTLGIAYQPIDRLIFKIDYQDYDNGAGTGTDQLNAAIGWVF